MRHEGPPRVSNCAPAGGSEAAKPRAWGDHTNPQGRPKGELPRTPVAMAVTGGLRVVQ